MARNAISDWDPVPGNNSDIAGINIAEGCPAGGINDAIRTVMAQFAGWLAGTTGPLLKSGGAASGAITGMGNGSTVLDAAGVARGIGYRNVPLSVKTAAYTLALSDVGQGVSTGTTLTIPTNATAAFSVGDVIAIYNNSSSSNSITAASGVTLRLAGASSTGTRTLAARGLASLFKVGTDEWVISGAGVS
ncbi:hypothetical protein ACSBM8_00620 [Sphingomonas sp. ASY06-1R]|jgi:hypothetical protein|uniref:hypothetical protein n=1 Tax=Sphingomonas sp. ASY06-1R TaxID=3445771 RepID=UPI003FA1AFA3